MIALLPVGVEKRSDEIWPRVLTTRRRIRVWQKGPEEVGPSRESGFSFARAGGTVVRDGDAWGPSLTGIPS